MTDAIRERSPEGVAYEPPKVEAVLGAEELGREVQYAGFVFVSGAE